VDETPVASLRIDGSGFRTFIGDGEFYIETSPGKYTSVALDGTTRSALDTSKVPSTESLNPQDIFIADVARDPRGGVVALVVWDESPTKTKFGIMHFVGDGEYRDLIRLDIGFTPAHVAEFRSNGSFLINGYDEHGNIKVALFDRRGTLINPQVLTYGKTEDATGKQRSQQADRLTCPHFLIH